MIDNRRYIAGPFLTSDAPFLGMVDPGPDGSYASETLESRKQSTYGYTEYAPSNIVFENYTEFRFQVDTWRVHHRFDAGFSVRAEHTRAYVAFSNAPFSVYDLSGDNPRPFFSQCTLFGLRCDIIAALWRPRPRPGARPDAGLPRTCLHRSDATAACHPA